LVAIFIVCSPVVFSTIFYHIFLHIAICEQTLNKIFAYSLLYQHKLPQGGMDMADDRTLLPHKLTLNERRQLTMTGVSEVISFDESAVVMRTDLGTLTVHGKDLQLKTLSLEGGQVAVDGTVSALIYEEPRQGGWARRLFG
jgi:sporulation protein YabP